MKKQTFRNNLKLFSQAIIFRLAKSVLVEVRDEQITQVQLACIRYVSLHTEPSVGTIADGLAISDAAAAKLIDRLVKKKILTREEDQQDRRVLKIKLTSIGKKLYTEVCNIEEQALNEIIARMSQADIVALETGLGAFLDAALVTPEQIEQICLHCGLEHIPACQGNLRYRELTGKDKTEV